LAREKSSQRRRIHFAALRDEKNRRFVSLGEAALTGQLGWEEVQDLIRHSYQLVAGTAE
jgi:hypothetical protein